jgi:hypothetical protein
MVKRLPYLICLTFFYTLGFYTRHPIVEIIMFVAILGFFVLILSTNKIVISLFYKLFDYSLYLYFIFIIFCSFLPFWLAEYFEITNAVLYYDRLFGFYLGLGLGFLVSWIYSKFTSYK